MITPRATTRTCFALAAIVPAGAAAAGPHLVKVAQVATPVAIVAPKASKQLFVVSQPGKVFVMVGGKVRSTPFLDLTDRVTYGGERGLLGLAFHPDYAKNGRFFVNYTGAGGATTIAEFTRSGPTTANRASARVLLTIAQPYENHNGGNLAFGPDGKLYIGMGDGGSGGDPQGNGQRLDTLLGKMLRIDVDAAKPYGIPAGNPFATTPGARPEIWAYGLRNPWRFSFDRVTGDLWTGDVGQGEFEEIDHARAGKAGLNYGWNTREGRHPFSGGRTARGRTTDPVAEYAHATEGCSVTGGFVYRGAAVAALRGRYVYGDFCSGRLWTLAAAGAAGAPREITAQLGVKVTGLSAFGEDSAGELYLAMNDSGGIYRFTK